MNLKFIIGEDLEDVIGDPSGLVIEYLGKRDALAIYEFSGDLKILNKLPNEVITAIQKKKYNLHYQEIEPCFEDDYDIDYDGDGYLIFEVNYTSRSCDNFHMGCMFRKIKYKYELEDFPIIYSITGTKQIILYHKKRNSWILIKYYSFREDCPRCDVILEAQVEIYEESDPDYLILYTNL